MTIINQPPKFIYPLIMFSSKKKNNRISDNYPEKNVNARSCSLSFLSFVRQDLRSLG